MVRGTNLATTIQMSVTFCDFARDISSIFFNKSLEDLENVLVLHPKGGGGGSGVAPGRFFVGVCRPVISFSTPVFRPDL